MLTIRHLPNQIGQIIFNIQMRSIFIFYFLFLFYLSFRFVIFIFMDVRLMCTSIVLCCCNSETIVELCEWGLNLFFAMALLNP